MSDRVTGQTAEVIVLGAGIVGVSAAYAARQRGLSVILIDRRAPGSETSYGNAGILSSGSISPLNNPSLWNALPQYLTNRHPALRWDVCCALDSITVCWKTGSSERSSSVTREPGHAKACPFGATRAHPRFDSSTA